MPVDIVLANLCSGLCGAALGGPLERIWQKQCSLKDEGKNTKEVQTELAASDFLVPTTPLRADESARLQRLCELQALGIESGHLLDEITAVLGWVVEVPVVLVSLVTAQKLCFTSRFGLEPRQAPREQHSLCAWCISPTTPSVLVLEDASKDKRTCHSGIVAGAPHIRFYAGCPLQTSDGFPLGTLCLIDQVPRRVSKSVAQLLINFAEIVTRNIEKFDLEGYELPSEQLAELDGDGAELAQAPPVPESFAAGPNRKERVCKSYEEAHLLVLVSPDTTEWPILWADSRWHKLTSISILPPSRTCHGSDRQRVNFWDVATWLDDCGLDVQSGGVRRPDETFAQLIRDNATFRLPLVLKSMGSDGTIEAAARCVPADQPLDPNAAAINPDLPSLQGEGREGFHIQEGQQLYFFVIKTSADANQRKLHAMSGLTRRVSSTGLFQDVALKQLIGAGSFGKVYLGDWIGAQVAVKVLQRMPDIVQPGSAFEAALSATLSHPNIVQTFEHSTREVTGEPDPTLLKFLGPGAKLPTEARIHETVIVQEWCDKGALSKLIETAHPLGPSGGGVQELVDITSDIASALAYMHARGIVHGDLSSNNVLLSSRPTARGYSCKVCDFGLARAVRGEAAALQAAPAAAPHPSCGGAAQQGSNGLPTLLGRSPEADSGKGQGLGTSSNGASSVDSIQTQSLGTVQYMPPEMLSIATQPKLTMKADVFSLGVIAWQLVTGKVPWEGLSPPQVVIRINRGKKLELPKDTPTSVAELVTDCTSHAAEKRPEAREVVNRLPQLLL